MTHRAAPQADGHPGTIEARVIEALCDALGGEPHELSPGMALVDDLGADSLDLSQIALDLEEHFDVGLISEADVRGMRTVADVVEYVQRRTAASESITS